MRVPITAYCDGKIQRTLTHPAVLVLKAGTPPRHKRKARLSHELSTYNPPMRRCQITGFMV